MSEIRFRGKKKTEVPAEVETLYHANGSIPEGQEGNTTVEVEAKSKKGFGEGETTIADISAISSGTATSVAAAASRTKKNQESTPLVAPITWAQSKSHIYLSFMASQIRDVKVQLSKDGTAVRFTASDAAAKSSSSSPETTIDGKKYSTTVDLFDAVLPMRHPPKVCLKFVRVEFEKINFEEWDRLSAVPHRMVRNLVTYDWELHETLDSDGDASSSESDDSGMGSDGDGFAREEEGEDGLSQKRREELERMKEEYERSARERYEKKLAVAKKAQKKKLCWMVCYVAAVIAAVCFVTIGLLFYFNEAWSPDWVKRLKKGPDPSQPGPL